MPKFSDTMQLLRPFSSAVLFLVLCHLTRSVLSLLRVGLMANLKAHLMASLMAGLMAGLMA
jgi:hypothetical protein